MAINKLTDDLNIIASLGNTPNTDDGLTAVRLKAKFDEAANIIKAYINAVLVPAIDSAVDEDAVIASMIDNTLSVSGKAADAAEIGRRLKSISTATEIMSAQFKKLNQAMVPGYESADYPGCYYRVVDGEDEWINPPMIPGMEYRTTERFYGKTVYAKVFADGLKAGSTVTLGSDVSSIVRIFGRSAASALPIVSNDGSCSLWYNIDGDKITTHADEAHNGAGVELTVFYVKKPQA